MKTVIALLALSAAAFGQSNCPVEVKMLMHHMMRYQNNTDKDVTDVKFGLVPTDPFGDQIGLSRDFTIEGKTKAGKSSTANLAPGDAPNGYIWKIRPVKVRFKDGTVWENTDQNACTLTAKLLH